MTIRLSRPVLKSAIALAVLVPLVAVSVYLYSEKPVSTERAAPQRPQVQQAARNMDLNVLAVKLAARLERAPEDGQGWALLGRSYRELHRYPEAAAAFAHAAKLLPKDASVLADYVDVLVIVAQGRWTPQAREVLQAALAADPSYQKTLSLAGSESMGRGDYRGALGFWKRLAAVAPSGSELAREAEANVREAQAHIDGRGGPSSGKQRAQSTSSRIPVP
jgi:cytochrome c-type biogenesis protein CcmH